MSHDQFKKIPESKVDKDKNRNEYYVKKPLSMNKKFDEISKDGHNPFDMVTHVNGKKREMAKKFVTVNGRKVVPGSKAHKKYSSGNMDRDEYRKYHDKKTGFNLSDEELII